MQRTNFLIITWRAHAVTQSVTKLGKVLWEVHLPVPGFSGTASEQMFAAGCSA
ncbi:MAG: hypothetical protein WB919_16820 [Candidatus Sulfotelmatobacter sp.]